MFLQNVNSGTSYLAGIAILFFPHKRAYGDSLLVYAICIKPASRWMCPNDRWHLLFFLQWGRRSKMFVLKLKLSCNKIKGIWKRKSVSRLTNNLMILHLKVDKSQLTIKCRRGMASTLWMSEPYSITG